MLSNNPFAFFPLGGCLGHKAFVLCVNQHIYILVGYIWVQHAGVYLLHYNEFIVMRCSQKGEKMLAVVLLKENILPKAVEVLTIGEPTWI